VRKIGVLDRKIGFIGHSVTVSLYYNPYTAIAELHTYGSTLHRH
jgi:hypothetical protein